MVQIYCDLVEGGNSGLGTPGLLKPFRGQLGEFRLRQSVIGIIIKKQEPLGLQVSQVIHDGNVRIHSLGDPKLLGIRNS